MLKSRSPPDLILNSYDEKEIHQLCIDACEPALVHLLRSVGAVEHLLIFIQSYVTTLNVLAMEIDTIEVSDSLRSQLKKKIALRRILLEAEWLSRNDANTTIDHTRKNYELLDAICNSCSNVEIFRSLSYEQLKKQYLDRSSKEQREILQTLWIDKNKLRLVVAKYNLPLMLLDWLNQRNITNAETITYQQVNEFIQLDLKQTQECYKTADALDAKQRISDLHDEFKANIMRLYNIEVIKRSFELKKNIEQQREHIAQALKKLLLINSIDQSDKTELRQRLTDIGTHLNVNWYFSKEEMKNSKELLDTIMQDLLSIQKSTEKLNENDYQSDEELITCISKGAALYGVQLTEPSKKVSRPLLLRPTYTPLSEPINAFSIKEFTFLSLNDAEQFIQAIETSGLTVATSRQPKFISPSSDDKACWAINNASTVENLSSQQITSFVQMRCTVVPIHSFRIGKEQMKLSYEAKTAMNLVTDLTAARKFLLEFGSHISDGIQHIGGILIHQISVQTTQKSDIETLRRIAECQWDICRQPGYAIFSSSISSVNQVDLSKFSTEHKNMKQTATVKYSTQFIGPSCQNLELFQSILKINDMSWSIIDRGAMSSFVPVWEIIQQLYPVSNVTMHDVAKLLKQVWLMEAGNCMPSESLLCEIDRIRLLKHVPIIHFQTPPIIPLNASVNVQTLVDQLNNQLNEYIDPMNFNCNTMTDVVLLKKVRRLFIFVFAVQ